MYIALALIYAHSQSVQRESCFGHDKMSLVMHLFWTNSYIYLFVLSFDFEGLVSSAPCDYWLAYLEMPQETLAVDQESKFLELTWQKAAE